MKEVVRENDGKLIGGATRIVVREVTPPKRLKTEDSVPNRLNAHEVKGRVRH